MRTFKSHTGILAGAVAALAMAALFSINSIAASASEPQAFTGRLTSAKGRVTINFAPSPAAAGSLRSKTAECASPIRGTTPHAVFGSPLNPADDHDGHRDSVVARREPARDVRDDARSDTRR